jgi:ubiquinone/menaquinone biosynthesis C-methylase UbiE
MTVGCAEMTARHAGMTAGRTKSRTHGDAGRCLLFALKLMTMILHQQLAGQTLERRPEPSQVTDAAANVVQYDQVMKTKLAAAYAGGLAVASRSLPDGPLDVAIDLACGPGHYTICLANYFNFTKVIGVDLSAPMVDIASKNARARHLQQRVRFRQGDATGVPDIPDKTVSLASCTDALHHMPNLDTVTKVLREMHRITSPRGLIMAMDLVRLRNEALTEYYVNVLGGDYLQRGLESFFDDFRNSMFAAWTADELFSAVPRDTGRWWCQLVPRGLPTVQVLLGLPRGQRHPFVRPAFGGEENALVRDWYDTWSKDVGPKWAKRTRGDCRIVQLGLATARRRFIAAH